VKRFLYRALRISNDLTAVGRSVRTRSPRPITRRIGRRIYGKATGRLARRIFG
jgi:hypothetical protein